MTGSGLRPETRQSLTRLRLCPTAPTGKAFPSVPALSGGRFVRETEQDAHHVGDGGRAPAAARALRRQAAGSVDEADLLDEKPARTGKLPSLSPALLRQLAGMGNNLNQIARRVNAGGGTGHDRVQIVAALMAIDAGLERLRHAVLERNGR